MKKILFLLVALSAMTTLWAGNVITYTAIKKLEPADQYGFGFHPNAFNTYVSSHTFSKGVGTITFAKEVTWIGSKAFAGCYALTSVTIPNSVTSIGNNAFSFCHNLTSVTIPNSVTSIGDYAFSDCYALTSITIPNSVTSIGSFAFNNVNNVVYQGTASGSPWGAKCVNGYVEGYFVYTDETKTTLAGCSSSFQGNIIIPNDVTSLNGAAVDCNTLTSVTLGNSVTQTGDLTASVNSVMITIVPSSVTSIGKSAFSCCAGLTSITIGNSVTSIGDYAFYCCTRLSSVIIGDSVPSIGDYAFSGCSRLVSVMIGNSVTSIGNHAFDGCSSLISITIPSSVTSMGYYVFRDCLKLTSITFKPILPPTFTNNVFTYCYKLSDIYIDCRADFNAYKTNPNFEWYNCELKKHYSLTLDTINGGKIESNNKYACDDEEVILTAISDFGYCFVKWSDGLTTVSRAIIMNRDYSFSAEFEQLDTIMGKCGEDLTFTLIPKDSTLTITGSGAMYDEGYDSWSRWADQIKIINLPQGLTHIGNRAFADCVNVCSMVIPASVVSFGCGAFYNDYNMTSITCYAQTPPTIDCDDTFYNVNEDACLFVQSGIIRQYQNNQYWQNFDIKPLGASSENNAGEDVYVVPTANDATFIWPANERAETYSLEITKDGIVFCTLIFNAQGQLTGIAFAPSKNGNHHATSAIMTTNGWQFTVTGLNAASRYNYTLEITDASQNIIKSYKGEFATDGYTALDYIPSEDVPVSKFIRDGQLYIWRDGVLYDACGTRVE